MVWEVETKAFRRVMPYSRLVTRGRQNILLQKEVSLTKSIRLQVNKTLDSSDSLHRSNSKDRKERTGSLWKTFWSTEVCWRHQFYVKNCRDLPWNFRIHPGSFYYCNTVLHGLFQGIRMPWSSPCKSLSHTASDSLVGTRWERQWVAFPISGLDRPALRFTNPDSEFGRFDLSGLRTSESLLACSDPGFDRVFLFSHKKTEGQRNTGTCLESHLRLVLWPRWNAYFFQSMNWSHPPIRRGLTPPRWWSKV